MIKKFLALMLALSLACISTPAMAASAAEPALYRLVSRDARGNDTVLGSAVLLMERTVLLTTVWAAQADGGLYAIGSGGEFPIERGIRLPSDGDLLLLELGKESPAAPLLLGSSDTDDLVSVGIRGDGTVISADVRHVTTVPYRGETCLLLTAEEDLLPGSVILGANGGLAGIVVAEYGEGAGRYVALPAENVYQLLAEDTQSMEESWQESALPDGSSWLKDVSVTAKPGKLLVDWSASEIEDLSEDSVFEVFFADMANPYYSYVQVDESERQAELPAVPGREYMVWVQHAHGEAAIDTYRPDEFAVQVRTEDAQPMELYSYADTTFYLGALPAEQAEDVDGLVPPLEAMTAEALSDPTTALCLQAVSTYEIDQTTEAALLVTLFTPEGFVFMEDAGFIYEPSLAKEDIWHVDVTELFSDYSLYNGTGSLTSGEYTLAYYLDGCLANSLQWTLP